MNQEIIDIRWGTCNNFLLRNSNILIRNITRIVVNQKYIKTSLAPY